MGGLQELKDAILNMISGKTKSNPIKIDYDDDIKEAVKIFEPVLNKIIGNKLNNRWTALRLIDGDETIKESINNYLGLNLSDDIELISLYDRLEEYLAEKNIEDEEIRDRIVSQIVCFAENVVKEVVSFENKEYYEVDRKIDSVNVKNPRYTNHVSSFGYCFLDYYSRGKLPVRASCCRAVLDRRTYFRIVF